MASGRLLMRNKILYSFLATTLAIAFACSSAEQLATEASTNANETSSESKPEGNEASHLLISSLSDSYASRSNELPDVFTKIKQKKEVEIDLTKGFRIQIYSGQNVFDADTIASQFRAWSDTTITGYQADTYTFFKTPYYRVHVGDFHNQEKALKFSRLVKRAFRDAWVVYDTVDPFRVPEDTVTISIITKTNR